MLNYKYDYWETGPHVGAPFGFQIDDKIEKTTWDRRGGSLHQPKNPVRLSGVAYDIFVRAQQESRFCSSIAQLVE